MVRTSLIVVLISTIAIGSCLRNGYRSNPGSNNMRYNPPPQPTPPPPPVTSLKDRIKKQPPAMPSFNLRAVSIFHY